MATAIEQLWKVIGPSSAAALSHEDAEAIVERLLANSDPLAAGLAGAALWQFGRGTAELARDATVRLQEALSTTDSPIRRVAARVAMAGFVSRSWRPGGDADRLAELARPHQIAAAELLISSFERDEHRASYLVQGASFQWNLEGEISVVFPSSELEPWSWGIGHMLQIPLPGAFQHFVAAGEYARANAIADEIPEDFRHPGVLGWVEVCRAHSNETDAAKHFDRAAGHFQTCPWPLPEKTNWSSFNKVALAPYCSARSILSLPRSTSSTVWEECMARVATVLRPDFHGQIYPPSHRLSLVIAGLSDFMTSHDPSGLNEAIRQYSTELERWGSFYGDSSVPSALSRVRDALLGCRDNLGRALTSGILRDAIAGIESLPARSPARFVANMEQSLGEVAQEMAQGTTHREILKLLEAIVDERLVHRLVRELARASSSPHAVIAHGPVEYGKDVVTIEVTAQGSRLRHYAAKAGDVTKKNWPSLKQSLEEALTVPLHDPIVERVDPPATEVIAVFNGHINPYVAPVVSAWRAEQSERGRHVLFWGIDELARLVRERNLVAFLRNLA